MTERDRCAKSRVEEDVARLRLELGHDGAPSRDDGAASPKGEKARRLSFSRPPTRETLPTLTLLPASSFPSSEHADGRCTALVGRKSWPRRLAVRAPSFTRRRAEPAGDMVAAGALCRARSLGV